VITHKSAWSLRGASFAVARDEAKQSHSAHEIASQKALATLALPARASVTLPAMWVITRDPMSTSRGPRQTSQDALLQEMVRRILATGNPQKIILFGSRARGETCPDSDYDLLLIEPSDQPRYQRAARYRRALTGLALAKDILVWTPEEVAQWQDVPNAFIATAVREGVVLYEQ
jgi:predicted nucleotidyltransferase